MELVVAKKKKVKIKVGLQGSSGSGKTFSALLIAMGMVDGDCKKIAVIDSEKESASLYTDIFGEFLTIQLSAPYTPERCAEAISICENSKNIEVIIFDSISHEWMGNGGILDLHSLMKGADMLKWAKLTPRHNRFIDSIMQCDKHMICTMRSKQDYVLTENEKGKLVPEKVGMKAVTRDGVDYEFTLNFDIDQSNFAHCTKDRTSLYKNKPEFIITKDVGKDILDWCNSGVDEVEIAIKSMKECKSLSELQNIWLSNKKIQSNNRFLQCKEEMKLKLK